ncbi:flippase [Candidatus Pacearchaeota archaeon]|nr:MAG: flippase [Candidatus Pacearchaeota archaeon]
MREFFNLNYLRDFLNTPVKKRLMGNFLSLLFLQGANYIFPLITLPYLVRVLGPEKFGLIAFAQAFIGYFIILTDYGFNLSATKEISIYRDNKEKISKIFNSVIMIKLGFMTVSFLILSFLVLTIPKFKNDWLIYFFTFGMVLGNVLFPVWFFQGMERMKYITSLNITAKLIFTTSIFIFIRKMQDYIYVPLISSLGSIIVGVLSLWIVYKNFKVNFTLPDFKGIKYQLKEGWHIFISTVAISLYTTSNTFILGLFTNNTIVGYYSAAEKIIKASYGLLTPVSQTAYPYISKLVTESKQKALNFIRKLAKLVGIGTFTLSSFLFIFATPIVNIVLGPQYQQSIVVLRILAFLPFIIGLSNILGIQTMLTFNLKKPFSRILISAGLLNVTLALILSPLYQHIGVSIAVLVTEMFVTLSMFFYLEKKGIKFFRGKL